MKMDPVTNPHLEPSSSSTQMWGCVIYFVLSCAAVLTLAGIIWLAYFH